MQVPFEVILARQSSHFPTWASDSRTSVSRCNFSLSAAWEISEKDSTVSFFHAYWHRGANCNCLLWYTTRWTPIANNLQEFFAHANLSLDSGPLRFFRNFHFWRQNSYFVHLAGYFFLPLSSICDDQVQLSSTLIFPWDCWFLLPSILTGRPVLSEIWDTLPKTEAIRSQKSRGGISSNLNPAPKEMILILLNCKKLKFVSCTSSLLEQMYDFQKCTMFLQKLIFAMDLAYTCVKALPPKTPNAFIRVSPNAFIRVSPNAFMRVSPNALKRVSPNASDEFDGTRFARLPLLASLAPFLTG